MVHGDLRGLFVAVQRIRVIGEGAYLHALGGGIVDVVLHLLFGEAVEVDVRDAGVTAQGLALRPAADLYAGKACLRGVIYDFLEGLVGQDGGNEAELHHFVCPP